MTLFEFHLNNNSRWPMNIISVSFAAAMYSINVDAGSVLLLGFISKYERIHPSIWKLVVRVSSLHSRCSASLAPNTEKMSHT